MTPRILQVFPTHFDQNGDSGNVLALRRRLEWAGHAAAVVAVAPGEPWPADPPDFVHLGGGSVAAQLDALPALRAEGERLRDWVGVGVGVIAVGGGYQLRARTIRFPGSSGPVEGLGLLPGRSVANPAAGPLPAPDLVSGPLLLETAAHGEVQGFVNLRQRFLPDEGAPPLGRVDVGPWPDAAEEGSAVGAVLGSHAHGPLLPRNPRLADAIIRGRLAELGLDYETGEPHALADAHAAAARAAFAERARAR